MTTQRDQERRPAPDLVQREFTATGINQLWVADMAYIPTWAGFVYLAVVLDVYSREVVGWAFGQQQTADLVIQALNMALINTPDQDVLRRRVEFTQYTSVDFGKRCKEMGVRPSMGSLYNPRRRHSGIGQKPPPTLRRNCKTKPTPRCPPLLR